MIVSFASPAVEREVRMLAALYARGWQRWKALVASTQDQNTLQKLVTLGLVEQRRRGAYRLSCAGQRLARPCQLVAAFSAAPRLRGENGGRV